MQGCQTWTKSGQIGPKWDTFGSFQSRFQYMLARYIFVCPIWAKCDINGQVSAGSDVFSTITECLTTFLLTFINALLTTDVDITGLLTEFCHHIVSLKENA